MPSRFALLFLGVALACPRPALAADAVLRPGALLGAAFSRPRVSDPGDEPDPLRWRHGAGGGLSLEWPLSERLALDTRLLWLDRGGRVDFGSGDTGELVLRYVALPVLVKWYAGREGRARPYVAAGPEVARRRDARVSGAFGSQELPAEVLRRWDFGLHAAAGTEVPLGRAAGFVEVSGAWGLRSQFRDTEGAGERVRTRGVLLGAGLRF